MLDVDRWLSGRISVFDGSISGGRDNVIHCWWDLIRSKQLTSVAVCHVQLFARFPLLFVRFGLSVLSSCVFPYFLSVLHSLSPKSLPLSFMPLHTEAFSLGFNLPNETPICSPSCRKNWEYNLTFDLYILIFFFLHPLIFPFTFDRGNKLALDTYIV